MLVDDVWLKLDESFYCFLVDFSVLHRTTSYYTSKPIHNESGAWELQSIDSSWPQARCAKANAFARQGRKALQKQEAGESAGHWGFRRTLCPLLLLGNQRISSLKDCLIMMSVLYRTFNEPFRKGIRQKTWTGRTLLAYCSLHFSC